MKKPFLLFALKCSVILYFAACTRLEHYTNDKSATPMVTEGTWKVNLYLNADKNNTNDFSGYIFTFNAEGNLVADKDGKQVTGNWSEDNIAKKIVINLGSADPVLTRLNENWDITRINEKEISLQSKDPSSPSRINISSVTM